MPIVDIQQALKSRYLINYVDDELWWLLKLSWKSVCATTTNYRSTLKCQWSRVLFGYTGFTLVYNNQNNDIIQLK